MPLNAPRPKGIIQRKITKLLQQGEKKMYYKFKRKACNKEEEKEIAIKDYDKEKDKQVCSSCGGKLDRVIEWQGIADSSNMNGWFGKAGGSVI